VNLMLPAMTSTPIFPPPRTPFSPPVPISQTPPSAWHCSKNHGLTFFLIGLFFFDPPSPPHYFPIIDFLFTPSFSFFRTPLLTLHKCSFPLPARTPSLFVHSDGEVFPAMSKSFPLFFDARQYPLQFGRAWNVLVWSAW